MYGIKQAGLSLIFLSSQGIVKSSQGTKKSLVKQP